MNKDAVNEWVDKHFIGKTFTKEKIKQELIKNFSQLQKNLKKSSRDKMRSMNRSYYRDLPPQDDE